MKPTELFDLCMDAIERFNKGEMIADKPFVMLVVPKATCPRGDTITLYGRTGPRGRVATVKERDGKFDVVAYFPAVPIIESIAAEIGAKVKVRRK
ncbi:hypothetical protein [Sphingobium sp. BS19]|uniref:hypothetical protein n=1 Tax=Sphingobium sp. BS19 TaxID=3018973 RepID=UPI0022EFAAC4|nr:hypothetical protein [Sphingobium sp. BS19]GLI99171.1 hypothetical protein Sbs19_29890 [Sphingobium sp. BS19]